MDRILDTIKDLCGRNEVFLAGGSVRDILLGKEPTDYDIVALKDPERTAGRIAENSRSRIINLGNGQDRLFRIITEGRKFDVTGLRGNRIEQDLFKRDFTINAMAFEIPSGRIIDPFGGREDLKSRIIRPVTDSIFKDDPVRMLRAYRIAADLGFEIHPDLLEMIGTDSDLIRQTAGERIQDEVKRLLQTGKSSGHLTSMVQTGLLFSIFPELMPSAGCFQGSFHEHDVLTHSTEAINRLETAHLTVKSPEAGPLLERMRRDDSIKIALLFHDSGKPHTRKTENAKVTFYGHEEISVELFQKAAARLRLSNRQKERVSRMIANHMRPFQLFLSSKRKPPGKKAFYSLYRSAKGVRAELICHAIADNLAKGKDAAGFIGFAEKIMACFTHFSSLESKTEPLITGYDLIDLLGIDPGPIFRGILEKVRRMQIEGSIRTKDDALLIAKECLKKKGPVAKPGHYRKKRNRL